MSWKFELQLWSLGFCCSFLWFSDKILPSRPEVLLWSTLKYNQLEKWLSSAERIGIHWGFVSLLISLVCFSCWAVLPPVVTQTMPWHQYVPQSPVGSNSGVLTDFYRPHRKKLSVVFPCCLLTCFRGLKSVEACWRDVINTYPKRRGSICTRRSGGASEFVLFLIVIVSESGGNDIRRWFSLPP